MTINLMTRFLDGHQIDYTDTRDALPDQTDSSAEPVLAQTVILNIDGAPAMAVIPAGHTLRDELLKELIEAENLFPVEPEELSELFPDCDGDAIPPLGILHGMRVFVSDALTQSDRIAFCAGCGSRVVELAWQDYFRLVVPIIAPISAAGAHTPNRPTRTAERELCLR